MGTIQVFIGVNNDSTATVQLENKNEKKT